MHEPQIENFVSKCFHLGVCKINTENYNSYDFCPILELLFLLLSSYLEVKTHPSWKLKHIDTARRKGTVTSRYIDMVSKLRYLTSIKEYPHSQILFCFLIFFRLENHKSSNDRTNPSLKGSSFLTFIHPFIAGYLSSSTVFPLV